jgi:hypothetical protein
LHVSGVRQHTGVDEQSIGISRVQGDRPFRVPPRTLMLAAKDVC